MLNLFLDRVSFDRCFGFRTHVVATTVCTHSTVAHTFFCAQRAHCVLRTSSCVSHTRTAQVHEKGVCRMSVSLFPSLHLPSHVSPILAVFFFFDGHFETTPDYDFTNDPVHLFCRTFPS